MLLSKGADPKKAVKLGVEVVATPLYWAAMLGSTEVVRGLLERGADANKGWRNSVTVKTPLRVAASQGHTEVVRSLLASGARQDLDTGGGELG